MSATEAEDGQQWHERLPERRAWELTEFEALGLPASESIDDDGYLRIDTELTFRDRPVAIEVQYPYDYPTTHRRCSVPTVCSSATRTATATCACSPTPRTTGARGGRLQSSSTAT